MLLHRKYLAGILFLGVLVTACAKPPERKVEEVAPPVLKIAAGAASEDPLFDALIAGFQAEHPDVVIERVPEPDRKDMEARLRFRAQGTADVVQSGLGQNQDLLDLSPLIIQDGFDLAPYGKAMEPIRATGAVHGLPVSLIGMMIAYNKELVAAAGVTIPTDGWTWDQFRQVARRLTRDTPDGPLPGMVYAMPEDLLDLYIEQKTGRLPHQTDEQTLLEALAFFDTMLHTDKSLAPVARRDLQEAGVTTYLGREFGNGKVPLSPVYVVGLRPLNYGFPYGLAPLPSHTPDGRLSSGIFGMVSITSGSKAPDLAWKFIKYATGPEGAKQVARAGYLPAYNSPDWGAWLRENIPNVPEVIYSLYETRWSAPVQVSGLDSKRYDAYLNAANRVMSGNARAEVAVADWKEAMKQLE
jgi:multiple sugar transport system substrate-binding protein